MTILFSIRVAFTRSAPLYQIQNTPLKGRDDRPGLLQKSANAGNDGYQRLPTSRDEGVR